jgi:hypothetical protein
MYFYFQLVLNPKTQKFFAFIYYSLLQVFSFAYTFPWQQGMVIFKESAP